MEDFYLLDYKGKFTIISDDCDDMSMEVGRISKEDAIREAPQRSASSRHYGVPAYIGDDKEGTNYSNLRLEKQKISSGTLDTILKTKSSSSPEKSENGTTARINLQSISNQQLEFIGKNSNEYVDYQTKNMVNELIYLFSQWNEYGTENSLHKITQIKELLDLYIKVLASKDENRIFLNTVNILVENNNWDELSENQLKQFITELKKFDDGVITWDRVGMFSKQVKRLELDFISNGKEEK